MSEVPGRAADALNPVHYVEHVTRTALLLEQLARDVKILREETESKGRSTETLRSAVTIMEKEFAVYRVGSTSDIKTNAERIDALEERLRWLSRLVIGAVLTGIIGGILGLVWRLAG